MVLFRAGIDIDNFGAHSVRSASTAKAKMMGVPISEIMKKAGWSNKSTFTKYYDKKVVVEKDMSHAVLKM